MNLVEFRRNSQKPLGAICNMQSNQMFLTLIDKNVFYDPIRVVKRHRPYIEIRDDPRFVIVYYSDSGAEREDDGDVSIDTHANPEF
ncbi:hypothetical protein F2Q69_00014669 [Brassica cretica]|uniref:Uncharacterized protein n=1 Tax=Brassica cretica TaxID=69181 RepID=A0A8S9R3P6_BRACR|nr:hypothetical protein F2Q69_00014669 [Brassica cretica]